MKKISLEDYAKQLRIYAENNVITPESRYGISNLVRRILQMGPKSYRELHRLWGDFISPLKLEEKSIFKDMIGLLGESGDIVKVNQEDKEALYAMSLPSWISLGNKSAVFLGAEPQNIIQTFSIDDYDFLRRFVINEQAIDFLEDNNVRKIELPQIDFTLSWKEAHKRLEQTSLEAVPDGLLVLMRHTGALWRHLDFENPMKPWGYMKDSSLDDGIYLGARKVNDYQNTILWLLIKKEDSSVKILTLRDIEEWRQIYWMKLLSEKEKIYYFSENRISFLAPLPFVLEKILYYFASKQKKWGEWKFLDASYWELCKQYVCSAYD